MILFSFRKLSSSDKYLVVLQAVMSVDNTIRNRNENLYLPNFTAILPLPKIDSVITNNQIKYVKSLHQRKFRQKYNKFIAEGEKIAEEILRNPTYEISEVYGSSEWIQRNEDSLVASNCEAIPVYGAAMSKISNLVTASPVLFVLTQKSEEVRGSLPPRSIYLDDVQDPGNVGTIVRIADWFGVGAVIRSPGSADFHNPKVIQATMGSFLNVALYTCVFEDLELSGRSTIGAAMQGTNLSEIQWPERSMLVMGNEGKGISGAILEKLDHHVTIPGSDTRLADSLNVGMACGILTASMMS